MPSPPSPPLPSPPLPSLPLPSPKLSIFCGRYAILSMKKSTETKQFFPRYILSSALCRNVVHTLQNFVKNLAFLCPACPLSLATGTP